MSELLRRPRTVRRLVALFVLTLAALTLLAGRDVRSAPRVEAAAIDLGRELFTRRWTVGDPVADGDGLGPVFNETSCVACHSVPGIGGAGPVAKNAVLFEVRKLVNVERPTTDPCSPVPQIAVQVPLASSLEQASIHTHAVSSEFQESARLLPAIFAKSPERIAQLSARNSIALFGIGVIDLIPDSAIARRHQGGGVVQVVTDMREYFRNRAQGASVAGRPVSRDGDLADLFCRDAVHGRVNRLADGRIGRFGWRGDVATLQEFVEAACANELGLGNPGRCEPVPLAKADHASPGLDLTREQCEAITAFLRSLPQPVQELPAEPTARAAVANGRRVFAAIGCADCHVPNLGPAEGIFSDLLLHDMADPRKGPYGASLAPELELAEDARPAASEWRTPPLWGVADSAPYMHDGSAGSLEAAIRAHAGAGRASQRRFLKLPAADRDDLLAFLQTLRAPVEARFAIAGLALSE